MAATARAEAWNTCMETSSIPNSLVAPRAPLQSGAAADQVDKLEVCAAVKIAHAPPVAFLAMPRQSRCTYMRKTITTAAARERPRPVPSPAALEPPNFQLSRLPGGAGLAAAAPARADALIPGVVILPTHIVMVRCGSSSRIEPSRRRLQSTTTRR